MVRSNSMTKTRHQDIVDQLDQLYIQAKRQILQNQSAITGLFPPNSAEKSSASIKTSLWAASSVFALYLAYSKRIDHDQGKAHDLGQSVVKCMRGILFAWMRQSEKVEAFKANQSPKHALHLKFDLHSGLANDADFPHLQIDVVSLYLIFLANFIASGLDIIYCMDEVTFIQNLVYYVERAYRTPDYGNIEPNAPPTQRRSSDAGYQQQNCHESQHRQAYTSGEHTPKLDGDGLLEIHATSIGMAKSALEAINGCNLFGGKGANWSIIYSDIDAHSRNRSIFETLLPRESRSKNTDSYLLATISWPCFATHDPNLYQTTKSNIVRKLKGRYGLKRFLRDSYGIALDSDMLELDKQMSATSWPAVHTAGQPPGSAPPVGGTPGSNCGTSYDSGHPYSPASATLANSSMSTLSTSTALGPEQQLMQTSTSSAGSFRTPTLSLAGEPPRVKQRKSSYFQRKNLIIQRVAGGQSSSCVSTSCCSPSSAIAVDYDRAEAAKALHEFLMPIAHADRVHQMSAGGLSSSSASSLLMSSSPSKQCAGSSASGIGESCSMPLPSGASPHAAAAAAAAGSGSVLLQRSHSLSRIAKRFEHIESEWPLFVCFLIIDGIFKQDMQQVLDNERLLYERLLKTDPEHGDYLIPKYYYVPPELIHDEKCHPDTVQREPSTEGSSSDHLYLTGQSILLITRLLLAGLVHPNELDPLRRHMPSHDRPKRIGRYSSFQAASSDLVVQTVLIAESIQLQAMMANYGIQTQTPLEVEPVQIWSSSQLIKVYEYLGVNEKLGLKGRPSRPIGALGTSKLYRICGQTIICYPLIFEVSDFYLAQDMLLLIDDIQNELNFIGRYWRMSGRPTVCILIREEHLRDVHFRDLLDLLVQFKNGQLKKSGLRIKTGRLQNLINSSCIEHLDFLHLLPPEHLPLFKSFRQHNELPECAAPLGSAAHQPHPNHLNVNQLYPNQHQAQARYQAQLSRRAAGKHSQTLLSSASSNNLQAIEEQATDGGAGTAGELGAASLAAAAASAAEHAAPVVSGAAPLFGLPAADHHLLGGAAECYTQYASPQIDYYECYKDAPTWPTLIETLRQCHELAGQSQLLAILREREGPSHQVDGLSVEERLERLSALACQQRNWAIVRYCSSVLKRSVESLSPWLTSILVNGKQISLGTGANERIVNNPLTPCEIQTLIYSEIVTKNPCDCVLQQEIALYIGRLISTRPDYFEGILTIRVSNFMSAMRSYLNSKAQRLNDQLSAVAAATAASGVDTATAEGEQHANCAPPADHSANNNHQQGGEPHYGGGGGGGNLSAGDGSSQQASVSDQHHHQEPHQQVQLLDLRVRRRSPYEPSAGSASTASGGAGSTVPAGAQLAAAVAAAAVGAPHRTLSVNSESSTTSPHQLSYEPFKCAPQVKLEAHAAGGGGAASAPQLAHSQSVAAHAHETLQIGGYATRVSHMDGEQAAFKHTSGANNADAGGYQDHQHQHQPHQHQQHADQHQRNTSAGGGYQQQGGGQPGARLQIVARPLESLSPSDVRKLLVKVLIDDESLAISERRRLTGELCRVPRDFYDKVWSLLGCTSVGIVIGGRLLRSASVLRCMTRDDLNFALKVESLLSAIECPKLRQLNVELLMALHVIMERNPEIRFETEPLDLDKIILLSLDKFRTDTGRADFGLREFYTQPVQTTMLYAIRSVFDCLLPEKWKLVPDCAT